MMEPHEIKEVVSGNGKQRGKVVGPPRQCRMEGCTGKQIPVQWSVGKRLTWPCTKAMSDTGEEGVCKIGA